MTLADLAAFEPVISTPVRGTYRGLEVVSAPAPHSGITLLAILNMFEQMEFDPAVHFSQSAENVHLMSEIFRRTYADRSQYIGDPRFVRIPEVGLTAKAYAREKFNGINRYRAEPRNYRDTPYGDPGKFDHAPVTVAETPARTKKLPAWSDDNDSGLNDRFDDPFDRWKRDDRAQEGTEKASKPAAKRKRAGDEHDEFDGGHTTHLSVIDADSNMVALTQTLGNFFGSKVMINGILLNNGRINFSSFARANLIGPGKLPRSSLTPTLVFRDGIPFLSLGSPGAGRIIATVAQVLVNLVDYGMDIEAANEAPRIFCQKFDDNLSLESRVAEDVPAKLSRMGHSVRVLGALDLFFGGVQMTAIWPATGEMVGSADPRRGGSAETRTIDSVTGGTP